MSDGSGMNFNTVGQPNYAGPLVDFSALSGVKKPATKQQASTTSGTPAAANNLGSAIRKWIDDYRNQVQRYGGGQGAPQAALPQQGPTQVGPEWSRPAPYPPPGPAQVGPGWSGPAPYPPAGPARVQNMNDPYNTTGSLY